MPRPSNHGLWLFCTLSAVALLVYFTPQRIPLPSELAARPTSTPVLQLIPPGGYSMEFPSNRTPDSFSFYAVGNNHAKAYTGFTGGKGFPQYSAESGLLDHP